MTADYWNYVLPDALPDRSAWRSGEGAKAVDDRLCGLRKRDMAAD